MQKTKQQLLGIYRLLYTAFGSRHWWPADSAEEVIIGAILARISPGKMWSRLLRH